MDLLASGRIAIACLVLSPGVGVAALLDSPLAHLVENQAPGTWLRVNQNQFQSTWIPKDQTNGHSPRFVISAWGGGGYDKNTGDFYVWGGDNGTYSGNEVYRWTASNLSWERLSLSSANTYDYLPNGKKHWRTVDGTDHSPISGETFDSLTFLAGVNRFAVLGGNAYPGGGLQYFRDDGVTRAGPFFFDPSKADAAKVGGLTGSQVKPAAYPNVVGGNMWENRQSIETAAGRVGPTTLGNGVSAATTIGGKDVVFVGEAGIGRQGRLFKYTVNSLDAAEDQWELVGVMGAKTFSGSGAGAYDSTNNVFMRTGQASYQAYNEATGTYVKTKYQGLMYWDLNKAGPNNAITYITPDGLLGDDLPLTRDFGIDYDPITDSFYLWSGKNELWRLIAPEVLGPTGWTVQRITPQGSSPSLLGSKFTGVYGKWNYMEGLGAFMGVVHDLTGDVWVYKPEASDFNLAQGEFESSLMGGTGWAERGYPDYSSGLSASLDAAQVPVPGVLSLALLGLFLQTALWLRKQRRSIASFVGYCLYNAERPRIKFFASLPQMVANATQILKAPQQHVCLDISGADARLLAA